MAAELPINMHQLQELAEEVRKTKQSRTVDIGPDVVAIIKPAGTKRRGRSGTDYKALSQVVGLGASRQPTNIAEEKGALLAEAFAPKHG